MKAVVFDFDGTLSTLRQGWEGIMEPFMCEVLVAAGMDAARAQAEVMAYVDHSTGIQTFLQMEWLAGKVSERGTAMDPWWYKAEYNRRLMVPVMERVRRIVSGGCGTDAFLVPGSLDLLQALQAHGIDMYLASGTDHADVEREAELLGVRAFFREVAGAPAGAVDCSKEAVLRQLVEREGLHGGELAVIGDGKVEIALGREAGALTLGVASDETRQLPIHPVKRERLLRAGADRIVGDLCDVPGILAWMGIVVRGADGLGRE